MRDALRTLFHPFETGLVDAPGAGERVLFLGAEPGFRLPEGFAASLDPVQGFRPHFNALARAGHAVEPTVARDGYDAALVLCGRHRGQNERRVAQALHSVVEGGLVVVAGSGDDGIASLRRRVDKLVPLEGHLPKHHGIAFWFRRPADPATAIDLLSEPAEAPLVDGRFATAPGMFSHDRVDAGSRLLAETLPEKFKGHAADFGAGWGYLAAMLAERTKGLKSIDLYEADHASLEAARRNLGASGLPMRFDYFWHDLVGEKVTARYDLIVMNPPFHQGRAAEPEIGQAMIKAASQALRGGGRLYMVANRGLPYDQTLEAGFSRVQELRREAAFRVVVADR